MKNFIFLSGVILMSLFNAAVAQPKIALKVVRMTAGPASSYTFRLYAKGIDGYISGNDMSGRWLGMNIRADIQILDAAGNPIPVPPIDAATSTISHDNAYASGSSISTNVQEPEDPSNPIPPSTSPVSINLLRSDGQNDLPVTSTGYGILLATFTLNFSAVLPATNKVNVRPLYADEDQVAGSFWSNRDRSVGRRPFDIQDFPLPVTLVSFNASREGDVATLNWETSEESNSDFFEILHSTTGKNWTPLGKVQSVGDSKVSNRYSFIHRTPENGSNLYRLRMVDRDETFAYSNIRELKFDLVEHEAKLYPNPSADMIFVQHPEKIKSFKVLDVNGNEVLQSDKIKDGINVTSLIAGTYVVKLTDVHGRMVTNKIVVTR